MARFFFVAVLVTLCSLAACKTTMTRHILHSDEALCNDGTPAVFYIGGPEHSEKWLLFLMGGWWCWDEPTCTSRCSKDPELCSTNLTTATAEMGGVFSNDPLKNPPYWDYRKVFLYYCSSDAWVGYGVDDAGRQYRGSSIIDQTLEALSANFSFHRAAAITFGGCSAGGVGAIANAARVKSLLGEMGMEDVPYHVLSDAGFIMDDKSIGGNPSVRSQLAAGDAWWSATLDPFCMSKGYSRLQCMFSMYALKDVAAPTFLHQSQADGWQVWWNLDSMPPYKTHAQLEWLDEFRGQTVTQAGGTGKALFSSDCFVHCAMQDSKFTSVRIHDTTLAEAVHRFEKGEHTLHLIDTCKGFNCSASCPASPW